MSTVRTAVRVRPLTTTEKEKGGQKVVKVSGDDKISVGEQNYSVRSFGPDASTSQVYKALLETPLTQAITRGHNLGVVCVGDSKSGKSTTLGGQLHGPGLVSLAAETIFKLLGDKSHFVGVTYTNVHREKLVDLINPEERELKIKTHPTVGMFVEGLSELSVKSAEELVRIFEQSNKLRKILELEMSISSTESHTLFSVMCEYRAAPESALTTSTIEFINVAGLNHRKTEAVSNSLKSFEALPGELSRSSTAGFGGSKLTQLCRKVMDKTCSDLIVLGHVSPMGHSTDTLEHLQIWGGVALSIKPNTLDTDELIWELRDRVAAVRKVILSQKSGDIPKEHIAELENGISALKAAKKLHWDERERASSLVEVQRRQTLADQGILEWVLEKTTTKSSNSVQLLQREKEELVTEYKGQRESVEKMKKELQASINNHTTLAEQPNQSEQVLQESLAKIHKLRDKLRAGNEKLKDLKASIRDVQDKLKTEKRVGGGEEREIGGSFTLTLTLRQDEMGQLRKDNESFLEEEKERLMGDAEQEIAEIRLSATQGTTLTMEQVLAVQERHAQQSAQLAHVALHVQCLQAENEKFRENIDALTSAHKTETETQKSRNLLVFRQYKDYHEDMRQETNTRYEQLVASCVQDAIFLSSKNAELTEENTELKKKLKHYTM